MTHARKITAHASGPGRANAGFTLIEVLVALGIVAIALIAGLQATTALTRNAERQSDMLLAQICADNELAKVRLEVAGRDAGRANLEEYGGVDIVVYRVPAPLEFLKKSGILNT